MKIETFNKAKVLIAQINCITVTISELSELTTTKNNHFTGVCIEKYGEDTDKLYMSDNYHMQNDLIASITSVYRNKLAKLQEEFDKL